MKKNVLLLKKKFLLLAIIANMLFLFLENSLQCAEGGYTIYKDWLTENLFNFNKPSAVAINKISNHCFIVDKNNNRIQKFDSNGNFITTWGSYGSGDGQFNYPEGIATDNLGNVYVADTQNYRIQKFDADGNFLTKFGGSYGHYLDEEFCPTDIAVDPSGNIYIGDYNWIKKFDINGNFVDKWYMTYAIMSLDADASGNLYALINRSELENPIVKLDPSGTLKTLQCVYYSSSLCVDNYGNIYVEDFGKINKYDPDGTYISDWGEDIVSDISGLGIDKSGNVYATDIENNSVHKFKPELYNIKGHIADFNGSNLPEIPVYISGSSTGSILTDSTGYFQFSDLAIGNYTITPTKRGYYFDKDNIKISPLNANIENQNFEEVLYPDNTVNTKITISGAVKHGDRTGIENAIVSLVGNRITPNTNTTTDRYGRFSFSIPIIHDAETYTLSVNKENYIFTPQYLNIVNVQEYMDTDTNITGRDFIGTFMVVDFKTFRILGGEHGYINTAKGEKAQFVLNPFDAGRIEVKIYDLVGTLVWETTKEVTGDNNEIIIWDGVNDAGEQLSSGVYIARISGAGINQIKKIAIVK